MRRRLRTLYAAQRSNLGPKDVREVFATFLAFETAYPNLARLHTLVTPRLPATLDWLARDPARVRRARPFYAPFADVTKASDEKLRADLGREFGAALGGFVADSVEIAERVLPDRDSALHAFAASLNRAFPHIEGSHRKIEQAFDTLSGLARQSLGVPLAREDLIPPIDSALGQPLFANAALPIHLRSDRNDTNEAALEIDASAFSGGQAKFPDAGRWRDELIAPMDRTARWLRSRKVARLAIGGSYRLTTAFALGHALRAATGFELEIATRGGTWSTDDRPRADVDYPPWSIRDADMLTSDCLIVAVGVLRDPQVDLVASGVAQSCILNASLAAPITSGHGAQSGVAAVKSAVSAAAARLKPTVIELYLAGPAAFAVALGHRWNALPPTQLHEFIVAERRYVRTALL